MHTHLTSTPVTEKRVTWIAIGWGLAVYFAGYFELFTRIPGPLFGGAVVLLLCGLLLGYYANASFRALCDSISIRALTLFHTWRIFAGWVFLAHSDVLPTTFVSNAAYGDILSGFLALLPFAWSHSRVSYLIFHCVGSVDFVVAVGTGLALTIQQEAGMEALLKLPLIMIPLLGVPLSGFTHFLSLKRLLALPAAEAKHSIN